MYYIRNLSSLVLFKLPTLQSYGVDFLKPVVICLYIFYIPTNSLYIRASIRNIIDSFTHHRVKTGKEQPVKQTSKKLNITRSAVNFHRKHVRDDVNVNVMAVMYDNGRN